MINSLKSRFIVLFMVGVLFILYSAITIASPLNSNHSQAHDVTLEKRSSSELVNLGEVYSYTIIVQNGSSKAIDGVISNPVPNLLMFQSETVTATMGTVTGVDNTVTWSGSVPANDSVVISYNVIPPASFLSPDVVINNQTTLEFGDTKLEAGATVTTQHGYYGVIWSMLRPIVDFVTASLLYIDGILITLNIPYAFGFAIIAFTLIIRGVTFPLNMQQIRSSKAMQELQPKLKALQEKYKDDREKLAMEQMQLYRDAGVNPLGGCLPMLIQMPIWIALYWALIQLSNEGLLNESFFWIPNLAGPVAYGGNLGWLWPFPPSIGWGPALSYLVLPVLLVVSQMYMQQMMTPVASDPQQAQMQQIMKFMPLMFGYFALIVPSGLTLYWFTSNILMVAQQYFTNNHLDNKPVLATPSGTIDTDISKDDIFKESSADNIKEGKGKNARSRRKSKRKR